MGFVCFLSLFVCLLFLWGFLFCFCLFVQMYTILLILKLLCCVRCSTRHITLSTVDENVVFTHAKDHCCKLKHNCIKCEKKQQQKHRYYFIPIIMFLFEVKFGMSNLLTICSSLAWPGARCSSVRSWCDGSSDQSYMVDPLSYFSFQPVFHD